MDWREYIHSDPEILVGKPALKIRAKERIFDVICRYTRWSGLMQFLANENRVSSLKTSR